MPGVWEAPIVLSVSSMLVTELEAMGYDGLFVPEAVHDGFLTSMAALSATRRIRVAMPFSDSIAP